MTTPPRPQPQTLDAILDAILAIAPTDEPRRWETFEDECYTAYMEGKKHMLWQIAKDLREAARRQPTSGR